MARLREIVVYRVRSIGPPSGQLAARLRIAAAGVCATPFGV
jgi:hypothetical protein